MQVQACWRALRAGVTTVICNGMELDGITKVFDGKKLGTMFVLTHTQEGLPVEEVAAKSQWFCCFRSKRQPLRGRARLICFWRIVDRGRSRFTEER